MAPARTEPAFLSALYDDLMAAVYLGHVDTAEVSFLRDHLHLGPGTTVLDQSCGLGSVSLPLAREGVHVIGVDQSAPYIAHAREAARDLPCEYHAADAADFSPGPVCDAAFNWRTGLGYADDAHTRSVLQRAFSSLRPGGLFALDYQHVARLLHRFQPAIVRRAALPEGEVVLLRESTLRLEEGVLDQRWTYFLPTGQPQVRHSSVRLYLPADLAAFLRGRGFADIRFVGDLRGGPLHLDSPRCIALCRRP